jgi:hypothetical protein
LRGDILGSLYETGVIHFTSAKNKSRSGGAGTVAGYTLTSELAEFVPKLR